MSKVSGEQGLVAQCSFEMQAYYRKGLSVCIGRGLVRQDLQGLAELDQVRMCMLVVIKKLFQARFLDDRSPLVGRVFLRALVMEGLQVVRNAYELGQKVYATTLDFIERQEVFKPVAFRGSRTETKHHAIQPLSPGVFRNTGDAHCFLVFGIEPPSDFRLIDPPVQNLQVILAQTEFFA